MKTCAYCTTENRDEAIFCRRCKRPLQPARVTKDNSARNLLTWVLFMLALVGLSYYFFSSRPLPGPSAEPTLPSGTIPASSPMPTRTLEPLTLRACVRDSIHIRRGPGTQYETIGGLVSGMCLTILGRDGDAGWVFMVSDDHQTGWVAASLVSDPGGLSKVSIRDNSAVRSSSRPTLTSEEIAHGAEVYLTQVAATNIPRAPVTRYMVPCFETANRLGDHVSCRMERAYCDYLPALEGSPTVCTDRPHPDHTFTLVVFGEDWSHYDGQCIIVSGYLEVVGGMLQIEALRPDQVSTCS